MNPEPFNEDLEPKNFNITVYFNGDQRPMSFQGVEYLPADGWLVIQKTAYNARVFNQSNVFYADIEEIDEQSS